MRKEMSEVGEVGVGQAVELLRHRRTVAESPAAGEFAHRLEQVVLALVGQARHLFTPGVVGVVAGAATMLRSAIAPRSIRSAG